MRQLATIRRMTAGLGIVTTLGVAAVAPAFAGTTPVSQTINAGTLAASVTAELSFDAINYQHDAHDVSSLMTMQVDDSRGSGEGWNITVEASDLVYAGDYSGSNISAGSLSITPSDPTHVAGEAIDATNGPLKDTGGSLDSARRVIYAAAGYGEGTYNQDLDVTISIPAQARAGTYSGTLTITEVSGPGN